MDITYNNIFQRTKGRLAQFKVCQKEILLEDICRKKLDYLPELAKPTLQFGQLGPFSRTSRRCFACMTEKKKGAKSTKLTNRAKGTTSCVVRISYLIQIRECVHNPPTFDATPPPPTFGQCLKVNDFFQRIFSLKLSIVLL